MAGPPVRHSSNHYSRGEDCQVGTSGSQLLSLRDRCREYGALLGPHAWDQPLSSVHSSRLTSCVQSSCAALTVPTSCVVFKKEARFRIMHRQFFYKKRNLQHLCRSPLALVFSHLGPHAFLPFSCATRFLPQRDTLLPRWPLLETVLLRFAGLGTDDHIICSVVRNIVVESGDEPGSILWQRILARRCHRSIGDNFSARDRESSTTGLKLPKHCGTGFVFALLQPSHRQEQKLIFTSLAWHVDLVCLCAYRISLAGGCLLPFGFFVDVFFLLCIWRRTRAMSFSPWPDGFWADSCTRIAGARSHASFFTSSSSF